MPFPILSRNRFLRFHGTCRVSPLTRCGVVDEKQKISSLYRVVLLLSMKTKVNSNGLDMKKMRSIELKSWLDNGGCGMRGALSRIVLGGKYINGGHFFGECNNRSIYTWARPWMIWMIGRGNKECLLKSDRSLLEKYLSLSKFRLAMMVVGTTTVGMILAPGSIHLCNGVVTALGTSLAVASASAFNQYIEVEWDSQMSRTKKRVLPSGELSSSHALGFAIITGATGTFILASTVHGLAATLALSNIAIYALLYTPWKRWHSTNTLVGAVVGAIPPIIGWTAQTSTLNMDAIIPFLVLFLWQLPHFHSLSWILRHDYNNAGYQMLVCTNLNFAVRHNFHCTLALLTIPPLAVSVGFCTPFLLFDGTLLTLMWCYINQQFMKEPTNLNAKRSFQFSLIWLPLFLSLCVLHRSSPHSEPSCINSP